MEEEEEGVEERRKKMTRKRKGMACDMADVFAADDSCNKFENDA